MTSTHSRNSPQGTAEAIERLDTWADTLTADDFEATDDLLAVARAASAVEAAKVALEAAVTNARAGNRSWNQIALSLGVSRQAARQRFGDSGDAEPVARAEKRRRAGVTGARSAKTQGAVTRRYDKLSDNSALEGRPKRATRGPARKQS